MMNRITAAIVLGGLVTSAAAQVTTTSVDRYTLTEYDVAFTGPTTNQIDGPFYGDWTEDTNDVSYWEGDAGGSANAYQFNSGVADGVYHGNLDVRADAQGSGFDFSFMGAQARYEVHFSVAADSDFNIAGWGGAFGAINGEHSRTEIFIENTDTLAMIAVLDEDNDYPSFDIDGTLPAGNYRLYADSTVWVDRTFETGFGDANAATDFVLTIVPAPGATAVLGLAGLATLRRRR